MSDTAIDGRVTVRDGARISYTRHPAPDGAPRVVFVHSLALDRSLWSGVIERLRGRVDMVALDCRGHGGSDRPAGPYTVEQFADDIVDVVDDIGWGSTTIVGCSMGGCVSQAFASRHGDRCDAAVFIDTTAWYGATAAEDWAKRAGAARAKGLDSLIPFQLTRWFGDAFREANPALMAHLTDVFVANDPDAYEATCTMLGAADLRESDRDISAPVAVLVGEDDQATPPEMARDLAERAGAGAANVVPGTRHLTPLENPGVVVDALLRLLPRDAARVAS